MMSTTMQLMHGLRHILMDMDGLLLMQHLAMEKLRILSKVPHRMKVRDRASLTIVIHQLMKI